MAVHPSIPSYLSTSFPENNHTTVRISARTEIRYIRRGSDLLWDVTRVVVLEPIGLFVYILMKVEINAWLIS